MAVYNYRKFKVLIDVGSPKAQGLRTGDIVRRLYFNGNSVVYTLMCVLGYGADSVVDAASERVGSRPYFIGALLEGDAPEEGQILDFIRITNLFDTGRGGSLYLSSLGQQPPYADVLCDIGKSCSLCWPNALAGEAGLDPTRQYVVSGQAEYIPELDGHHRVCHITGGRVSDPQGSTVGISQEFYQNVAEGDKMVVSYKVKASRNMDALATFSIIGTSDSIPSESFSATSDWTYKLHVVTVDNPGRLLRTFGLSFDGFTGGDGVWIADLNIITLSSLSSFSEGSLVRLGRLDGIDDPAFGQMNGQGGRFRRMFATGASHVSGTLTPGDAEGFGSTFYAGRIHRNAFINSIAPTFVGDVDATDEVADPTGMSLVYKLTGSAATMVAQGPLWLANRIGLGYSFSFFAYANKACEIAVKQNGTTVGTVQIRDSDTNKWIRRGVSFNLLPPAQVGDGLLMTVEPSFDQSQQVVVDRSLDVLYVTSPQLEVGGTVTQYQPTDDILDYTEDYGAWLSRGGLGGTIQNPLMKLNADGNGSIATKGNSILIKDDGSGHIAQGNIAWDEEGNVTFGDGAHADWEDLQNKPDFLDVAVENVPGNTAYRLRFHYRQY